MEKVLEVLAANAPLAAALGVLYWKLTPVVLKSTLQNGGGEIVRRIVKEENAAQSKDNHAAIEKALTEHEEREWRQYGTLGEAVAAVRERVAALDARISDHLARSA